MTLDNNFIAQQVVYNLQRHNEIATNNQIANEKILGTLEFIQKDNIDDKGASNNIIRYQLIVIVVLAIPHAINFLPFF